MANIRNGQMPTGFVHPRRTAGDFDSFNAGEIANMHTITDARARLKALFPSTYTDAVLDTMTANDMVYALRVASGNTYLNF